MKTLKSTLIAIAGTLLLLMMVMVNVQVGLNDDSNSDLTLLGTDISLVESVFAQDTPPGEEGEGLSCNDLSNCKDGASCSGEGFMRGPCEFTCGTMENPGPEINCGENEL